MAPQLRLTKAVQHVRDGVLDGYYIWCQGCKHVHFFPLASHYERRDKPPTKKPVWTFSGSLELPTFSPSLRCYYTHPESKAEITTCHCIVTGGRIQFCADCQHELKGQTLELEFIPGDYGLPPDS